MRIIRLLAALLMLGTMFFPGQGLAAKIEQPNETQTNLTNQENPELFSKLFAFSQPSEVQLALYNFQKGEPEKNQEEIERDFQLARFKDKLDTADLPRGKFAINASAYTAAADECGKSDGITASGVRVKENRTLACPSAFPFGSKINIDGHGIFVCEDRGGAIKDNHFDIYMQTKKQAFDFGRRILLAEVVE
jgi:3D (Asp-Asp-Asp) domain-containing protein